MRVIEVVVCGGEHIMVKYSHMSNKYINKYIDTYIHKISLPSTFASVVPGVEQATFQNKCQ